MNAAKDTGVGNFRNSSREIDERASAGADVGINRERSVGTESLAEDESRGATDGGMAGGIFRVSRSSGGKEIKPGHKCRVRIGCRVAIEISGTDSGDGAPEDIAIFGIPASDAGIGHGDV